MSQEDLATTFRRAMDAYSRRQYAVALASFDPAIEWTVHPSVMPDATTYHGHDGVMRFWKTWAEVMSELELDVEECRNVPENRVVAVARALGTGAGSGAPVVSRRFVQVAEFRDGRVVAVWLYGDMASARKATWLGE